MKKCFIVLFAILLLICSCEDKNEACILRVNVKDPNIRTVTPDKSQSTISRYVLKGVFAGRPIIEQSQTSTFTVSIEQRGLWSMYVEAYAKDGKLVAKSDSQSIEILPYKDVEATFQLKPIFDGNGTFNFKLGIPKDVTTMDKILCSLSSEEGTLAEVKYEFDFKTDATIDGDYSIFTKTLNLPAGSYNLKVETTNVLGDVYGIPINDSVVILTDQTSDYEHIWDMAYFPQGSSITVNNGSEYFPGYLYISKSSDDAHVYCSFDNGEFVDITDKIQNNYVVLADAKHSNLRIVATLDTSKWTRGNSNIELKTLGPAGGVVFYDCDADNEYGNKDGLTSSECKWRYLEAAPENLSERYIFGFFYTSSSSYNAVTSSALGKGKENTENLVKQMGTQAKTKESSYEFTELYAARMASLYSYNNFNDWFLPSKDELNRMYLVKNHIGSFSTDDSYWSSSEYSYNFAWDQHIDSGFQYDRYRSFDYYVRPVRAF